MTRFSITSVNDSNYSTYSVGNVETWVNGLGRVEFLQSWLTYNMCSVSVEIGAELQALMWPCPAPSNVRLSRLATVWQGILEGSSHSFSWYKVSMCAQLETQDGDMEAMRLPASLDQGVRLRRQSQEGSSNQVRSGPFSLVTNSRRVTGGLTCLLQNTYTPPPKLWWQQ